jgi:tetratricopeptide (TPR) repeat protein
VENDKANTPDDVDAVKDFVEAVETALDDKSEAAVAKAVVATMAIALGSPWWLLVEPFLRRALEHLNNKAGRDAVLEVAKEIDADKERRKLVEALACRMDGLMRDLLAHAAAVQQYETAGAGDEIVARIAVMLSRTEDRLRSDLGRLSAELAPHVGPLRALSPGVRPLAALPTPSSLLVAAHEAVPFVGRTNLLEALDAWVDAPERCAVALVVGRGGSGKTRLAIEMCARLRARRIAAGFLIGETEPDGLWNGTEPRVIVVDYPEGKPDLLARLLRRLATASPSKVRLILLARGAGEWWDALTRIAETDAGLLHRSLKARLDHDDATCLSLEERERVWKAGVAAFRGVNAPGDTAAAPDFAHETFHGPLPLLMHALLAVHGSAPESEPELLSRVLEHEYRHQAHAFAALRLAPTEQGVVVDIARQVLAVATLLGGAAEQDLVSLVQRRLREQLDHAPEAVVRNILRIVAELYPHPHGGVAPLEPDILGEQLVDLTVQARPDVLELAVEMADTNARRATALRIMAGIAERTGVTLLLDRALAGRIPQLTEAILNVLLEPRASLATAVAAALPRETSATIEEFVDAFHQRFEHTTALLGLALDLARAALEAAPTPVERVRRLVNLGTCLVESGRFIEALEVAEAAVRETKIGGQNDVLAFAEPLPHAYNLLSLTLAHLGLRRAASKESFRAVTRLRLLTKFFPGVFEGALAGMRVNLAQRLKQRGHHRSAYVVAARAVTAYRALHAEEPRQYARDLASALLNAGPLAGAAGRAGEELAWTREAVAILRPLADAAPDAVTDSLALALDNLATALEAGGSLQEAHDAGQEAVKLFKALADRAPSAFGDDYARALANHASVLSGMAEHERAVTLARVAVAIRETRPKENPIGYCSGLASSLHTLANICGEAGRFTDGLAAADQSIALVRAIPELERAAFEPELARTLATRGSLLRCLGNARDALAATEDALRLVERHRGRLRVSHDASVTQMVEQYLELGATLGCDIDAKLATGLLIDAGRVLQASALYERVYDHLMRTAEHAVVLELGIRLIDKLPPGSPQLGARLANVGNCYATLGKPEESLPFHARAQEVFSASGDRRALALLLGNRGVAEQMLGRLDDAKRTFEAALELAREVGEIEAEANCLANLGNCLLDLHQPRAAVEHLKRALELDEALQRPDLRANQHGNLGNCFIDLGDIAIAMRHFEASLELRQTIGSALGEANARYGLARCHAANGEHGKAIEQFNNAAKIHERVGNTAGTPSVHTELGSTLRTAGDIENALKAFESGYSAAVELKQLAAQGRALDGMGTCEMRLKRFERAVELHEAARSLACRAGDTHGEAVALEHISRCNLLAWRLPEAIVPLEEAIRLDEEKVGPRVRVHHLAALGNLYLLSKNVPRARALVSEALQKSRAIGLPEDDEVHKFVLLALAALESVGPLPLE